MFIKDEISVGGQKIHTWCEYTQNRTGGNTTR
jgi:hypothetical protein